VATRRKELSDNSFGGAHMRRIGPGFVALMAGLLLPFAALAQTKITIGYTSLAGVASIFVAKDNGYFANRGIDANLLAVSGGHALVPGLVANSIQIATLTAPTLVQADDAGLDLVGLTTLSVLSTGMKSGGVVARTGTDIKTAQDLIGKKVGVGTIGSISQVLFDKWLMTKGVDPKRLAYVEVAYPQMPDVIKAKNVDALILPDPFMTAIIKAGTGYLVAPFFGELPDNTVSMISASTRDWAAKNPQFVDAYRSSIGEAAAWIIANDAKAKEIVGRWLKLSPEIMANTTIEKPVAQLGPSELKWWVDTMNEQKLLRSNIEPGALLPR
jgi:NitT/TauT family transport system substrate-binding protein